MKKHEELARKIVAEEAARIFVCKGSPAQAVSALADYLFERWPAELSLAGRILVWAGEEEDRLYQPAGGGPLEDIAVIAAQAVAIALWGRFPSDEELDELMEEDQP